MEKDGEGQGKGVKIDRKNWPQERGILAFHQTPLYGQSDNR